MKPPAIVTLVSIRVAIAFVLFVHGAYFLPHAVSPPLQEEGLDVRGAGRASLVHQVNPADENSSEVTCMTDVA